MACVAGPGHHCPQANKAAATQATDAAAKETEKAAPAASGWGDAFLQVCQGWYGQARPAIFALSCSLSLRCFFGHAWPLQES
jgi:hypothetical protein